MRTTPRSLAALRRFLCHGMRGGYALLLGAVLLASPLVPAGAGGRFAPLTPEEKGKQIYTTGKSPSGKEIIAVVSGADVSGSALPCASCHGADGRGRPEGGVRPANVTWDLLTTELKGNGRARPAYDERKLRRAITMGLDPAGAKLHAAMPRYRMSSEDIASLIAYLRHLGREREAGLTDTTIDVLMVSSIEGTRRDAAREAEGIVAAYFAGINERGGIYNRSLRLRLSRHDESDGFAIIGGVTDGRGDSLLALMSGRGIPAVGIRALDEEGIVADHLFTLFPPIAGEAAGLALNARGHLSSKSARGVITHPEGEQWKSLADRIIAHARAEGWNDLGAIALSPKADPASLARSLQAEGVEMVMPLGLCDEMSALFDEIVRGSWRPSILITGECWDLDRPAIPRCLEDRVVLSYPSWLESLTPAGMNSYTALRARYHLETRYLREQLYALAGAMVFVEGLKRTGRELTREKLVAQLERLYQFETGLVPPVTFGPNRRAGSDDLYIMALGAGKPALLGRYAMSHRND